MPKPDWWSALEAGDTRPFDKFLARVGCEAEGDGRF